VEHRATGVVLGALTVERIRPFVFSDETVELVEVDKRWGHRLDDLDEFRLQ
jgi:hypothetical protein